MKLKPGQTVRIGSQWGTISYFTGNNKAVVMLDDLYQVPVGLENVKVAGSHSPVVSQHGQGQRT